jgi:uncharacterized repeat protein (TIGR02543 family)
MADQEFVFDAAEQPLTANAFEKEGYSFTGWATSQDGAKVYDDKELVQNLTSQSGEVVNLYALWEANTYTVSFDANLAGVSNPESITVTYDQPYGELEELSKEGYTFNGWKDGESFVDSGTIYQTAGNKVLT